MQSAVRATTHLCVGLCGTDKLAGRDLLFGACAAAPTARWPRWSGALLPDEASPATDISGTGIRCAARRLGSEAERLLAAAAAVPGLHSRVVCSKFCSY